MQPLFSRALILSWALWFGGLVGVLLSVTTIFAALAPDGHAAGAIATQVFKRADNLVMVLAALSLISAIGLLANAATKSRKAIFAFLLLAAILGIGSAIVIAPKIDTMRKAGTTESPEFKKLHGLSMAVALVELLSLAAVAFVLPTALRIPTPAATPVKPAPQSEQ